MRIVELGVLYILTSILVLSTPNASQNIFYVFKIFFCKILMQEYWKLRLKEHIFDLFWNAGIAP